MYLGLIKTKNNTWSGQEGGAASFTRKRNKKKTPTKEQGKHADSEHP
jgi:hypothetical protein